MFARIKAGDEEAKEQYIKGNLRLVLSVIKRFGNSNENPDDLFQIGCIGLIKAINNFNTELDEIQHLCCPDDNRGNPKIHAGQQQHTGEQIVTGYGI